MNKRHYEHTLPNIRGSLSNTYAENMNAIYPCFQSIVNRIFSSFGIVSRDLFSATVRLVRGVRCIFAGL